MNAAPSLDHGTDARARSSAPRAHSTGAPRPISRAQRRHARRLHEELAAHEPSSPGGAPHDQLATPATDLRRYLPPVLGATFLVAICPVLAVWSLRAFGLLRSGMFGTLLAMGLSLAASVAARRFWQRRADAGDLLFGELMIWGFIRRWRQERRLVSALAVVDSMNHRRRRGDVPASTKSQAKALEDLSAALEARDPYTHGHSRRVARHAWMIAQRMGLPADQVARIRTAAAVHDIGKLETPGPVLRKPGRLTDAEYEVIKRHPVDGARIAAALGDAELAAIVCHHHERLDGTGYPSGLAGEKIPLGARIIAVADTFDAITSARQYRPARPHKAAIDVLKREAGTQVDPAVVRTFTSVYAGRRPLVALWSSLASLPGQAFAWAADSIAGVLSTARVVAVAALVGGASAAGAHTILSTPALHANAGASHAASAAPGRAALSAGGASAAAAAGGTRSPGKAGAKAVELEERATSRGAAAPGASGSAGEGGSLAQARAGAGPSGAGQGAAGEGAQHGGERAGGGHEGSGNPEGKGEGGGKGQGGGEHNGAGEGQGASEHGGGEAGYGAPGNEPPGKEASGQGSGSGEAGNGGGEHAGTGGGAEQGAPVEAPGGKGEGSPGNGAGAAGGSAGSGR
jgi:HD domain